MIYTLEDQVSGETLIYSEKTVPDLKSLKNTKVTYWPDLIYLENYLLSEGKHLDASVIQKPATEIS